MWLIYKTLIGTLLLRAITPPKGRAGEPAVSLHLERFRVKEGSDCSLLASRELVLLF